MERLTEKIGNTNCVKGCGSNCKYGFQYCTKEDWENCKTIDDVIDKLAEYEGLEEHGRLIKLPCKVGDTVYAYCSEFGILAYTVYCIVIDKHITYQCGAYSESIGYCPGECLDEIEPDISDFGKTVFLTQAEAEAKLKELRGGNEQKKNNT